MTWLGWFLMIAGLSIWSLGAWGWFEEVGEFLRSRGRGRIEADDDQGAQICGKGGVESNAVNAL